MPRPLRIALLVIVAADVLIALVWAAAAAFPALPVYYHGVSYIAPYCSKWRAVVDSRAIPRMRDREMQIRAASTVLRTEGRLTLVRTPYGEYWIPADPKGHTLAALLAQHAENYYGDVRTGVQPGDIVIDCGSHVGTFTRDALRRGAQLVVAVDPAPDVNECFRRNLRSEIDAGRVRLVEKGIWDHPGELTFNVNGNASAAGSFVVRWEDSPQIGVPVTTIDDIATGLPGVSFIKSDVKGVTARMLIGAAKTLLKYRPRMVLATEEPPEDPNEVVTAARSIVPEYGLKCGKCFLGDGQIRLEAVFLR